MTSLESVRSVSSSALPLLQEIKTCPLCNSRESHIIHHEQNDLPTGDIRFDPYRTEPVFLKECDKCNFAYIDRLPTDNAFYDAIYTNLKPDWKTEFYFHGKKEINREIKKLILKYKTKGALLDIGSWAGAFLFSMKDHFEVQGIELNPDGARCAQEMGLMVKQVSASQAVLPERSLDVVTLIDVLEHLPDPGFILEKTANALKSGGLIYIKVPNYQGQLWKQRLLKRLGLSQVGIMQNYVHINHFTRESLGLKLKSLGFEVAESGYTGAETWDLSAPQSFSLKLKRWMRNVFVNSGTTVLNALTHLSGIEFALNLYIIGIKR